jgi:hypothetical protein
MARFSPVAMIDNGVAALSAFSAGFLAFAMPENVFSRLIVASRIPQFLASAQPPLGLKARLVVVALVAIVAYAFVWSMLRALDKITTPAEVEAEEDGEPEYEAPRLRRADAHPDAPSRRPLLAGSELGEPAELDEYEIPAEAAQPWLSEEVAPAFEPAPIFPSRRRSTPGFLVPQDEAPEPEPIAASAPADPTEAAEPAEAPEPVRAPEEARHSAPIPAAAMLSPADAFSADDGEDSEDDSDAEIDDDTLSKLMNRFENGLSRKQQALPADRADFEPAAIPAPAPVAVPDPVPAERIGHRLRSAITDLNRISAQGN